MPSPPLDPEHVAWQKQALDDMPVGGFAASPRMATIIRKMSADTVTLSGLFPDAVEITRQHIEAAGYKIQPDPAAERGAQEMRLKIKAAGEWPAHLPDPETLEPPHDPGTPKDP